eukprot:gene19040-20953_t
MDLYQIEEKGNPVQERKKKSKSSSRRSSILKKMSPPRTALKDIDPNNPESRTPGEKKVRKSIGRRVSFAEKLQIKEFHKNVNVNKDLDNTEQLLFDFGKRKEANKPKEFSIFDCFPDPEIEDWKAKARTNVPFDPNASSSMSPLENLNKTCFFDDADMSMTECIFATEQNIDETKIFDNEDMEFTACIPDTQLPNQLAGENSCIDVGSKTKIFGDVSGGMELTECVPTTDHVIHGSESVDSSKSPFKNERALVEEHPQQQLSSREEEDRVESAICAKQDGSETQSDLADNCVANIEQLIELATRVARKRQQTSIGQGGSNKKRTLRGGAKRDSVLNVEWYNDMLGKTKAFAKEQSDKFPVNSSANDINEFVREDIDIGSKTKIFSDVSAGMELTECVPTTDHVTDGSESVDSSNLPFKNERATVEEHPQQQSVLLRVLSGVLREEGAVSYAMQDGAGTKSDLAEKYMANKERLIDFAARVFEPRQQTSIEQAGGDKKPALGGRAKRDSMLNVEWYNDMLGKTNALAKEESKRFPVNSSANGAPDFAVCESVLQVKQPHAGESEVNASSQVALNVSGRSGSSRGFGLEVQSQEEVDESNKTVQCTAQDAFNVSQKLEKSVGSAFKTVSTSEQTEQQCVAEYNAAQSSINVTKNLEKSVDSAFRMVGSYGQVKQMDGGKQCFTQLMPNVAKNADDADTCHDDDIAPPRLQEAMNATFSDAKLNHCKFSDALKTVLEDKVADMGNISRHAQLVMTNGDDDYDDEKKSCDVPGLNNTFVVDRQSLCSDAKAFDETTCDKSLENGKLPVLLPIPVSFEETFVVEKPRFASEGQEGSNDGTYVAEASRLKEQEFSVQRAAKCVDDPDVFEFRKPEAIPRAPPADAREKRRTFSISAQSMLSNLIQPNSFAVVERENGDFVPPSIAYSNLTTHCADGMETILGAEAIGNHIGVVPQSENGSMNQTYVISSADNQSRITTAPIRFDPDPMDSEVQMQARDRMSWVSREQMIVSSTPFHCKDTCSDLENVSPLSDVTLESSIVEKDETVVEDQIESEESLQLENDPTYLAKIETIKKENAEMRSELEELNQVLQNKDDELSIVASMKEEVEKIRENTNDNMNICKEMEEMIREKEQALEEIAQQKSNLQRESEDFKRRRVAVDEKMKCLMEEDKKLAAENMKERSQHARKMNELLEITKKLCGWDVELTNSKALFSFWDNNFTLSVEFEEVASEALEGDTILTLNRKVTSIKFEKSLEAKGTEDVDFQRVGDWLVQNIEPEKLCNKYQATKSLNKLLDEVLSIVTSYRQLYEDIHTMGWMDIIRYEKPQCFVVSFCSPPGILFTTFELRCDISFSGSLPIVQLSVQHLRGKDRTDIFERLLKEIQLGPLSFTRAYTRINGFVLDAANHYFNKPHNLTADDLALIDAIQC